MDIEKSLNDKREYEYYELDNKLKVLIITDNNTTITGCVASIKIGSIDDTIEGIAHFLEHLLFMGSEKYPEENYFTNYISKNCGTSNAYTTDISTTYYFTINSNALLEAIDIFSGFFINPLFKQDSIKREIYAIESEHSKNISNDNWISNNIYKKLYKEGHPAKKFTTGNLTTLKCDNIREKIEQFYLSKYSSHLMNVVILRNNTIDNIKLKKHIKETFGQIKLNNILTNRILGNIINKGLTIKYVPISDIQILTILFETKTYSKDKKIDPLNFICHIFSREDINSIHNILFDKGWIINIQSDKICSYDDNTLGCIEIHLSDSGFINKNTVIKIILEYIKMFLDNINKPIVHAIYNELQKIYKIVYNNWITSDIETTLLNLSSKLLDDISPNELLSYKTKLVNYDIIKPMIYEILSNINIESISIGICSKIYNQTLNTIDQYYNTEYLIYNNIYSNTICYNNNFIDTSDIVYIFPQSNKYISEHNNLILGDDFDIPLYIKNDVISIYYNFNSSFKIPMTNIKIIIEFPLDIYELKTLVANILSINSKYSNNNAELYLIKLANYTFNMELENNQIIITISGYTSKILEIIKFAVDIILHKPKQQVFVSAKKNLMEQCINYLYNNLQLKIEHIIHKYLLKNYYIPTEFLEIIHEINYEESMNIFSTFLKKSNITLFINGNINNSDVLHISNEILRINTNKKCYISPLDRMNINIIHNKIINCHNSCNPNIPDSYVSYMIDMFRIRIGLTKYWDKLLIFGLIFNYIVHNKFFDELRTKEQIGYIVYTNLRSEGDPYYKNIFLSFNIQSSIKKPTYIISRIESFIINFNNIINNLSDKEYESYSLGLKMIYLKPFDNLFEQTNYLFSHIKNQTFIYNERSILISSLQSLTKNKFIKMANKYVFNNPNVLISCIIP